MCHVSCVTCQQGSRKSKIGWELTKMAAMCGPQDYKKIYIFGVFKLIKTYYHGFYAFVGLLNQFVWHSPFPVPHFCWWILISEAISAG